MNLEDTIAELEAQAQKFTAAANTLRTLQTNGSVTSVAGSPAVTKQRASKGSSRKGASSKSASPQAGKSRQKRFVSEETRAKIKAALKASHAKRKAAAA